MTVFSFHPVKIIAAGEGGMITTNSEALYRRLLRLRSHGINKLDDAFVNRGQAFDKDGANPWYYEMQELGFNYRMTDIQAALAMSQFAKIDKFLARRREIAAAYDDAFETHSAIMPTQKAGRAYSAHHLYVILADFGKVGRSRRDVMLKLRESGIYCQVHYIPVYMHPYYETRLRKKRDFPATRQYYERALSIPMYYSLSRAEQEFVIREITEALNQ